MKCQNTRIGNEGQEIQIRRQHFRRKYKYGEIGTQRGSPTFRSGDAGLFIHVIPPP